MQEYGNFSNKDLIKAAYNCVIHRLPWEQRCPQDQVLVTLVVTAPSLAEFPKSLDNSQAQGEILGAVLCRTSSWTDGPCNSEHSVILSIHAAPLCERQASPPQQHTHTTS